MTARWIALEGGEGSGKSTQARLLADALGAVLTREPGGTAPGKAIRELLLDRSTQLDARTEALLLAADRAEHIASVVRPPLDAGTTVVSDRSVWSSLAYQGYGRGLPIDELWKLSDWAMAGRWPDLAVLIDVPASEAAARIGGRGPADRMEEAGGDFHQRVRDGFAALVSRWPDLWVVVDGIGAPDDVAARVLAAVKR